MVQTTYFPVGPFEAACCDGRVELRIGPDVVIWMTFFDSGVFTVREPGRGHAGRFPLGLLDADLRERVSYALQDFTAQRAA